MHSGGAPEEGSEPVFHSLQTAPVLASTVSDVQSDCLEGASLQMSPSVINSLVYKGTTLTLW